MALNEFRVGTVLQIQRRRDPELVRSLVVDEELEDVDVDGGVVIAKAVCARLVIARHNPYPRYDPTPPRRRRTAPTPRPSSRSHDETDLLRSPAFSEGLGSLTW